MPFVNIKLVKGQISKKQKNRIIEGITDLIVNIMNRDRNLTVITVDELSSDDWAIGGKTIEAITPARIPVFINIKVSKGTTTAEEINKMIAASKELLTSILGNSDECNYFIVDELNPDMWGFDGQTMTERRKNR